MLSIRPRTKRILEEKMFKEWKKGWESLEKR